MDDGFDAAPPEQLMARRGLSRRLAADAIWMRSNFPGQGQDRVLGDDPAQSWDPYEHRGDFEHSIGRLKPQYPRNDWVPARPSPVAEHAPSTRFLVRMLRAMTPHRGRGVQAVSGMPAAVLEELVEPEVTTAASSLVPFIFRGIGEDQAA